MKRTMLFFAVAVALAGAVGFYGGMQYADHQMLGRLIAAPLQSSAIEPQKSWEISDYKDQMTDKKSVWLSLESSTSPKATLQLSCSPKEDVSIYSDRFYRQSDDYYVTYRIDEKPAISMNRWRSITKFASPPNVTGFISELSGGHKLLVSIYAGGDTTHNLSFDMSGYDQKLVEFRDRCNKLSAALLNKPMPVKP